MRAKGSDGKVRKRPATMTKPAMMDWALRLLRLLNERKVLTSRIVAEEFEVNIRTAQRYLFFLATLPCVVVDEEKHTYSLTSDYVISDKILNTSEMALVCALIDYATHIFGKEHSKFLMGLKSRIFKMPDVYQIISEEAIDMGKVASIQLTLERHIKQKEIISFTYSKKGKRYAVEPYKILYHEGFWYLVGLNDGIVKKFVLDFIEGIRTTGREYDEIPENVRKTLHEAKTIWFKEKEPDRVTVEFDAEVAHFFERKRVFPRQEIVGKSADGRITVAFEVHNEMDFRELVARWMPYFTVRDPVLYREAFYKLARRACERNRGTAPGSL
jgi:predicted DNA-binding transcriptional regulator YafY